MRFLLPLLIAPFALSAAVVPNDMGHRRLPEITVSAPYPPEAEVADWVLRIGALIAWQEEQVRIYLGALQAQADEEARQAALQATQRARQSASAPTVTGSCCGPHSDAWWWGVAICEQSGRNDPYYGYFSFMDGSQGGRPWDEQVAAANALLARAGRESPTWAQTCVDAGYRASPGG